MNYHQNNAYPQQGMYQQQQQQQQLPVSPLQVCNQPIPVSPGQVHFVPAVNVPQPVQQYLPLITSVIIMEIQNKMSQNPLRTFMFNLYSLNQYNNKEFAELVEICANYIHLAMMNSREYNTIEGAVFGVCQNITTMMACAQVKMFPALMQHLPPELQQSAINGTRALENAVRETMTLMRPQSAFGNSQQYHQHQQTRGNVGAVATMAASGGSGYGLFDNSTRFSNQPDNRQGQASNLNGSVNRYRKQLTEQNSSPSFTNQGQSYTPVSNGQVIPTRGTVADFISANNSGYKSKTDNQTVTELTFAPNNEVAVVTEQVDSQPKQWFDDIKGEEMMDYDKHVVGKKQETTTVVKQQDVQKPVEQKSKVKEYTAAVSEEKQGLVLADCRQSPDNFARLRTKLHGYLDKNDAHITNSFTATPVIFSGTDVQLVKEAVSSIHSCGTFVDVVDVMNNMTGTCRKYLFPYLEDRLTTIVNSILGMEMAVEITIDSFNKDVVSLMNVLEKSYGEDFITAFFSSQRNAIIGASMFMSDSEAKDYTNYHLDDDVSVDEDKWGVMYGLTVNSFIHLGFDSKVLSAIGTSSTLITEDSDKRLYSTLVSSLDRIKKRITHYHNTFVITEEGMFQTSRGLINPEAILVRKVS